MRGAMRIAAREMRDRRVVLVAALVAGLVPFASPLFPGVPAERVAEARDAMALILSGGLGLILALLLGATVVARDLAENRLAFDFARPVSGLGIWAGRLGSAVVLTLAAMAIVLAPAMLAGGRIDLVERGIMGLDDWLVVPVAILLAVGLAHVVSVAARSRSRWLALDLAGLVVGFLLAASGIRRLYDAFAVEAAFYAGALAILALIPALWIASAVQVARGRTDLAAGYRIQSITLWAILLPFAILVAGFSIWYVSPDVDDIAVLGAEPSPAGSWITVEGTARWRPGLLARAMIDTGSDRSVHLPSGGWRSGNTMLYSRDGRRAVLLRRESPSDLTISLSVLDLTEAAPRAKAVPLELDWPWAGFETLSPSGTRLGTLDSRNLVVLDVDRGGILAAARRPDRDEDVTQIDLAFVDDDRLRAYYVGEHLVVSELDVTARTLSSTTGPEPVGPIAWLRLGPGLERLLLARVERNDVLLLDGRTGEKIREMRVQKAVFLADGRIATVGEQTGSMILELRDRDGAVQESFDLWSAAPRSRFWIGAEAVRGSLLIAHVEPSSSRENVFDSARLMLVDLERGSIREIEGNGIPIVAMPWTNQRLPVQPESSASRLVQVGPSVALLDPETLTVRKIAEGPRRLI